MSEPNPTGKVVLVTSQGEIQLELFCKQIPLACRNFIQLCLEVWFSCIFLTTEMARDIMWVVSYTVLCQGS